MVYAIVVKHRKLGVDVPYGYHRRADCYLVLGELLETHHRGDLRIDFELHQIAVYKHRGNIQLDPDTLVEGRGRDGIAGDLRLLNREVLAGNDACRGA